MAGTGLALLILAVSAVAAVAADDFPKLKDYDDNDDGKLTPAQAEVFALHWGDRALWKLDTNKNGDLEDAEALAYAKKVRSEKKAKLDLIRLAAKNNESAYGVSIASPLDYDQVADVYSAHPPPEKYNPGPFRMRGRVADFSVNPKGGDISKVNPAIFSWSRNFIQDGDTWAARGAVGAYFESENKRSALSLGADFDRVDSDVPGEKDVDTLVFRAMGSWMPAWGKNVPGADALEIRYGADYGTNFNFEGGALGAAMELEPIWSIRAFKGVHSLFGTGGGRSRLNSPAIALRNHFRIEGGSTVDDFQAGAGQNGDYLRAGGVVEAALWPFGTDRPISLTASYGYLAELAGDGPDYHSFKAGVEWRLDKEGHFALRLEYVNGLTPLVLQEQENLLLSLSVRF